jgi:hypothetical protein
VELNLRGAIVGSQRQEGRSAEFLAQVGIKPTIRERNSAVVGVSSENFGIGSGETKVTGHVRLYID